MTLQLRSVFTSTPAVFHGGYNMPILNIEGEEREYEKGTTFEAIAREYQDKYDSLITGVIYGTRIRELMKKVDRNETLR